MTTLAPSPVADRLIPTRHLLTPWHGLLVFLVVLACNLWGLGAAPLARTEPHRAMTGSHMAQHGNWLLPELHGNLYLRKPPLTYWLIAVSEKIAGQGNEFVWRLPGAISSALLAVMLWLMAARWFGKIPGLVGGLSLLTIIAIWSQSRSAEIDSINTTAAVIASAAILELLYGPSQRKWLWAGVLSLGLGATLLAKGPAGVPLILAAMIGPAVAFRTGQPLCDRKVWVGILGGLGIFLSWVIAVKIALWMRDLHPDMSGIEEMRDRLAPQSSKILRAAAIPFELLAYGVPVTASLISAWLLQRSTDPHKRLPDNQQRLLWAIVITAFTAQVIFALGLIQRPRYGYPALPLWCLACAGVALAWARGCFSESQLKPMRAFLTVIACVFAALQLAFAFGLPPIHMQGVWPLLGSTERLVVGALCGLTILTWVVTTWAWVKVRLPLAVSGLVVLAALTSIGFNIFKNYDRQDRSGRDRAEALRQAIDGADSVIAGTMVMAQPELFYYSGIKVKPRGFGLWKHEQIAEGGWILFDELEWKEWEPVLGERLTRITPLVTKGSGIAPGNVGENTRPGAFAAWYTPPGPDEPIPQLLRKPKLR